jgi:hypothetical protein
MAFPCQLTEVPSLQRAQTTEKFTIISFSVHTLLIAMTQSSTILKSSSWFFLDAGLKVVRQPRRSFWEKA